MFVETFVNLNWRHNTLNFSFLDLPEKNKFRVPGVFLLFRWFGSHLPLPISEFNAYAHKLMRENMYTNAGSCTRTHNSVGLLCKVELMKRQTK